LTHLLYLISIINTQLIYGWTYK